MTSLKEATSAKLLPHTFIIKVWSLLPGSKRKEAVALCGMMVLGMLFEMLGVGLIVPFVTMLTKDGIPESPIKHELLHNYIYSTEPKFLIVGAMVILIIVYLVKNLYLALLAWRQSKFIFNLQSECSKKLFSIYLKQPYQFHIERNSAHLIRNVYREMNVFINSAVSSYIFLLAESLVIIGLFGLLVYMEPLGTLIVFTTMFVAGGLYQQYTKHHIYKWGKQRIFHEGQRLKHLQEGLFGVKDVMVLGRESDFITQYDLHTRQTMKMNRLHQTLQQITRLWLELLAILGLGVLTAAMIAQGKLIINILPTIALFAAVSFRLMPSVNRIIGAIQQLRFGIPTINLLTEELNLNILRESQSNINHAKLNNKVEFKDVSFAYDDSDRKSLDSISIQIKKGDFVGFVGKSGAGKSTLVDLMLGLLLPSSGEILKDGINIEEDLRAWRSSIGYVPQSIYLTDGSIRKNVAFGIPDDLIDEAAVATAIRIAQLDEFISTLPDKLETIVGERGIKLSGGQIQRIGIARALYHDPDILVLDEATSALDNETEQDVMQAVKALKGIKTILVVAHRLSTVAECNYIYRLNKGRVVNEGLPEAVLK